MRIPKYRRIELTNAGPGSSAVIDHQIKKIGGNLKAIHVIELAIPGGEIGRQGVARTWKSIAQPRHQRYEERAVGRIGWKFPVDVDTIVSVRDDKALQVLEHRVEDLLAVFDRCKITAGQKHDLHACLMSSLDELRFQESLSHRKTAIRIPRHASVDDMSELVEWNLRHVVGRIQIFASRCVVGYQSLGEAALVFLRQRRLDAKSEHKPEHQKRKKNERRLPAQSHETKLPGKFPRTKLSRYR